MGQQKQKQPTRHLIVSRLVSSAETVKQTVGYVVLSFNNLNSNFTVDNVPMNVMHSRVGKNEIENATLVNNTVTLQGVTEKDLPVSILGQNPQSVEDKVMVLDRVVRREKGADGKFRDRSVGFRVFAYWGITSISAYRLIESHKTRAVRAINAKVVTRDGDEILSAKRGNFGVIQDYFNDNKEPKKSPDSDSNTSVSDTTKYKPSEEEKKKYHLNFRKKSVDFFVKQFMRSGQVHKIKTKREVKFAKVALKEFFLKKYPDLKNLKSIEGIKNNTILEVGVVLLLSSPEGKKMYLTQDVKNLNHTLKDYELSLAGQEEDETTLYLASVAGGEVSQLLENFLRLRRKVVDFSSSDDLKLAIKELENLIEEITSLKLEAESENAIWLVKKAVRLLNDFTSALKNKKWNLKQEKSAHIRVADIKFDTPEGFHLMGYNLLGESNTGFVDTIYGYKQLRTMFDLGVPSLKVSIPSETQLNIVKNIRTFGDAEITRSLMVLGEALKLDKSPEFKEKVKELINLRLALMAKFNLSLALILNNYLGEVATFSLKDAQDWKEKLTRGNKVYYFSGMKFNSPDIVLEPNSSWSYPAVGVKESGSYKYSDTPANKVPEVYKNLLQKVGLSTINLEKQHMYYVKVVDALRQSLK